MIVFPFHQDQRQPDDLIPLPGSADPRRVDPAAPAADRWTRLRVVYDALADAVAEEVAAQGRSVAFSGDCLASLGVLAGVQRAGLFPGMVWFDAHGDVHTLASSTSGYLGGMPLRMAVGGDPDRLTGPLGIRPLTEDQAVLVDARDLDPAELAYLESSPIHRLTVDQVGSGAIDGLLAGLPLVLHVDLDVIDAEELTGARFPVGNGPSTAAVLEALGRVLGTGRVVAFDVSCPWYPATGPEQVRYRAALVRDLLAL